MVMAIAGAAVLTQIQGIVSDQTGSIMAAYVVPASWLLLYACMRGRVAFSSEVGFMIFAFIVF